VERDGWGTSEEVRYSKDLRNKVDSNLPNTKILFYPTQRKEKEPSVRLEDLPEGCPHNLVNNALSGFKGPLMMGWVFLLQVKSPRRKLGKTPVAQDEALINSNAHTLITRILHLRHRS
jgi:hypothetical protein